MCESRLVGTGQSTELPAIRKDGTDLWVELTLSPIEPARVPGNFVLALIRDVTARRDAEAQLAAANASLRDFMRMAAHDLRNPLTVIKISAELLSSRALPDDAPQLVSAIARQAGHLSTIIDDLAALSELEAGQTQARPSRNTLVDVVADARESAGLYASQVDVDVPDDLTVWADRNHVQRILTNFFVNAANYAGGDIRVLGRPIGTNVDVVVEDTGPGVPASFVPHLFDKFTRVSGPGAAQGSGLGLAIVAGLARLNEGDVWYEANEPHGSRFCVHLPGTTGDEPPAVGRGEGGVVAPA